MSVVTLSPSVCTGHQDGDRQCCSLPCALAHPHGHGEGGSHPRGVLAIAEGVAFLGLGKVTALVDKMDGLHDVTYDQLQECYSGQELTVRLLITKNRMNVAILVPNADNDKSGAICEQ